ncbi:13087_t:CDS:2 [Ambispora gerdemannii]|uniref:Ribokinase n=1 Tax=Ambispora gerdemannii TaxID=144530 RepID=A0A9N9A873_9GLOM|nr:13087_t:CDS:2 [Ambispora gerdemannii]
MPSSRKVLVFGSINIDDFFDVPHIVNSGETLTSTNYRQRAGGKGANQAVALAKAGANVYHAGKIGSDGIWIKDYMRKQGVHVENIQVHKDQPTGRAIVQVSAETHDNAIILLPGANSLITVQDAEKINPVFRRGDIAILQNEISAGGEIMKALKEQGFNIIFNPTPITPNIIREFPFELVDYLIVNKHEAIQLANQATSNLHRDDEDNEVLKMDTYASTKESLIKTLGELHPNITGIILTLGSDGVIARFNNHNYNIESEGKQGDRNIVKQQRHFKLEVPVIETDVIDTTAAGDTFIGYFVASIIREENTNRDSFVLTKECYLRALQEATVAAGIAVSRPGAMDSIPPLAKVKAGMKVFDEPPMDYVEYEEDLGPQRSTLLCDDLLEKHFTLQNCDSPVIGENYQIIKPYS